MVQHLPDLLEALLRLWFNTSKLSYLYFQVVQSLQWWIMHEIHSTVLQMSRVILKKFIRQHWLRNLKNQCWFTNPILILAKLCYRLLKLLLDFVKVISYKKQLRSWDSHFIEVVWIIRMLDYYRLRFHSELHLLLCTIEAIPWSITVLIDFIIHTMHMDIYIYIFAYKL